MSDQQETGIGAVLDLEELFLSREFGRRPGRSASASAASAAVESEPAHLEQVFLSEVFGHPEVVAAATQAVSLAAPAASRRPMLVLLHGGGDGSAESDNPRARAIAAVSGIAAAALAVAGLTSGTAHGPGRPPVTEQAQGVPGPADGSQPGPARPVVPPVPSETGTSRGAGSNATLTAFSRPVASVLPRGAIATVASPPPGPAPSGGGPTPGLPPAGGGGGGGSMLTPALTIVGNEVSGAGSSVTATSANVGHVLQALGTASASAMQ
jgi:hypothetical protein